MPASPETGMLKLIIDEDFENSLAKLVLTQLKLAANWIARVTFIHLPKELLYIYIYI